VDGATLEELQPELLAERHADSRYEFDLRVPGDLAVWPGHFPEFFVVPGVLQVDWVLRFAMTRLGFAAAPPRIDALKFKTPLRPLQPFTMRLDVAADPRVVDFVLSGPAAEIFSRGRLHFSADASGVAGG
jgi:3-hydroxyacyl-[acyl-carrier-protein] dehydratase